MYITQLNQFNKVNFINLRKVRNSITIFLILWFSITNAQPLYMPRDIKEAFKKETRSILGTPGKNYWQNKANYIINIETTPPSRIIKGDEKIVYFNNSPDTLKSIFIRLIQNQHLAVAPKEDGAELSSFTTGISIKKFFIEGKEVIWKDPQYNVTLKEIELANALLPHASITINCEWTYELTTNGDREGVIDSTTFFFAYFFPRIAVYDDYIGWDKIPFIGRQEFYNDFSDFVLNVKVPQNYIVWSTGMLQNANEVLEKKYLDRLNESAISDSVIHIVTAEDLKVGNITRNSKYNTWKWTADNIMDVAFGISDHYVWDATSISLDSLRQRVLAQAAYNDTAWDFHFVAKVTRNTLDLFSKKSPGVAYPYPKMTIFQGYYDMEYPMMVNDNSYDTYREMEWTTFHEMAHTFFPFYMGINESRHAFMDEGWATFLEFELEKAVMPRDSAVDLFTNYRFKNYTKNKTQDVAMPITSPSYFLSGRAYSYNSYAKPSMAYLALKELLGEELFKKSLHYFMTTWNGKHPIPYDFFNCINTASGKDLNWFWNRWFFSNNYVDLGISNVKRINQKYTVSVNNIGGFVVPINLRINYIDGTSEMIYKSPSIWRDQVKAEIVITTKKKIKEINLENEIFLDSDSSNNEWRQ